MAGLINTGLSYEQNALSGFVRESEEQKQIDMENQKLKAQKHAQEMQMIGEVGALGLSIFTQAGGWSWLGAALF